MSVVFSSLFHFLFYFFWNVTCCSSKTASLILLVSTQVHLSQSFCLEWKHLLIISCNITECMNTLKRVSKEILLSFTHPHVIPKMYQCLYSSDKRRYSEESVKKIKTMEVNDSQQLFTYQQSSEYLLLCSTEERNSYRFGTYWRWVNDDMFSFLGELWVNLFKKKMMLIDTVRCRRYKKACKCWTENTLDRPKLTGCFIVSVSSGQIFAPVSKAIKWKIWDRGLNNKCLFCWPGQFFYFFADPTMKKIYLV